MEASLPARALPPPADGELDWLGLSLLLDDAGSGGAAFEPLPPRALRCLDATHGARGRCGVCAPPPAAREERCWELVRDAAGRPGALRARALLALPPE